MSSTGISTRFIFINIHITWYIAILFISKGNILAYPVISSFCCGVHLSDGISSIVAILALKKASVWEKFSLRRETKPCETFNTERSNGLAIGLTLSGQRQEFQPVNFLIDRRDCDKAISQARFYKLHESL